jgi:hypothetical protein
MSVSSPATESTSKFVVFQSNRGLITLPNGQEYEMRELRPHPTDPTDPKSPVWYEGFVSAKNTDLHAADKIMQTAFDKDGAVPAHMPSESNARPLQLKLNPYPEDKKRTDGKSPDYIGSLLTSDGFYTVFARKMDGKGGLLLAGSVAPYQPKADAEALQTPKGRHAAARAPGPQPA